MIQCIYGENIRYVACLSYSTPSILSSSPLLQGLCIVKVEPISSKQALMLEAKRLTKLQGSTLHMHDLIQVYIGFRKNNKVYYVVMNRLSLNLSHAAEKNISQSTSSPLSTLRISVIQAVMAVRAIHDYGFIHRDIKPCHVGDTPDIFRTLYIHLRL